MEQIFEGCRPHGIYTYKYISFAMRLRTGSVIGQHLGEESKVLLAVVRDVGSSKDVAARQGGNSKKERGIERVAIG